MNSTESISRRWSALETGFTRDVLEDKKWPVLVVCPLSISRFPWAVEFQECSGPHRISIKCKYKYENQQQCLDNYTRKQAQTEYRTSIGSSLREAPYWNRGLYSKFVPEEKQFRGQIPKGGGTDTRRFFPPAAPTWPAAEKQALTAPFFHLDKIICPRFLVSTLRLHRSDAILKHAGPTA